MVKGKSNLVQFVCCKKIIKFNYPEKRSSILPLVVVFALVFIVLHSIVKVHICSIFNLIGVQYVKKNVPYKNAKEAYKRT